MMVPRPLSCRPLLAPLEVMGKLQQSEYQRAGAEAVGMDLDRYRAMTTAVDDVLSKWQGARMFSAMSQQMDTANLPPEAKAQMREGAKQVQAEAARLEAYERVPPQNVEVVLKRAAELDPLRVLPAMLALQMMSGSR